MKCFLSCLFFFSFLCNYSSIIAQPNKELAKKHFLNYLDSKTHIDLLVNCLPTKKETKYVMSFNSEKMDRHVKALKSNLIKGSGGNSEVFVDCRINTFTATDIRKNKGNYAGGMTKVKDCLPPVITFYKVTFLRTPDDGSNSGYSFKYFIYKNDRWIFLPKPWRAIQ